MIVLQRALAVAAVAQATVTAAFSAVAAVSALLAMARARRVRAGCAPFAGAEAPTVILLRPCEAATPKLGARLEADATAYAGPLIRILCVPAKDAAAGAPEGVLIATSGLELAAPTNRKMQNLAAGERFAQARGLVPPNAIFVHADADVDLGTGDIDDLVHALVTRAPTGAAFAAPLPCGGRPLSRIFARLIVAFSPQSFAVLAALARITGSPPALAGKLVALRATTLQALGGYGHFAPFIADDIALVDALHAEARPIALAVRPALVDGAERSIASLYRQLVRWLAVASSHRPGLLLAYPTLVAPALVTAILCLACLLAPGPNQAPLSAAAMGVVILTRSALALALALGPYQSPRAKNRVSDACFACVLVVGSDALVSVAAIQALMSRTVAWAGRRYRVARGGRIMDCK